MEQQPSVQIHYLAEGLTVSVMAAERMAPYSHSACEERRLLELYLEPIVSPLISAKFFFAEIETCVRGALLKLARGETPIVPFVSEEEVSTIKITKGQVIPFPEDR